MHPGYIVYRGDPLDAGFWRRNHRRPASVVQSILYENSIGLYCDHSTLCFVEKIVEISSPLPVELCRGRNTLFFVENYVDKDLCHIEFRRYGPPQRVAPTGSRRGRFNTA
jgi:hypothetical protein